ncbi:hypothetical protein [Halorubellus salinus]|uniref:hypothetical protein n=1 Tax=Halorubellus salinus TaxID=755309 RepID=UPI001D0668CB|nr:hypothetical protein [Halorubellus salinus]
MTDLPGNRETAYRVFAAEFDDATVDYQESDEERAPNYVVTPTGARANRLFVVGVLTEIEDVNDDVLRARIVDPTGAFVVYAGQYQPDEMAALERLDPPAFVAVTGKARTFQPEDSDRVFTSIRPESITTVDAATRDRWVVRTAEHTVERVGTLAAAATLDASGDDLQQALEGRGVAAPTASGAALALEGYGTTPAYLAGVRELAVDAAEVVAGDRDEVEAYDRSPSDAGDGTHSYADLAGDLGDTTAAATTRPDQPAAADTATPTEDDAAPEPTDATAAPSAGEAADADATAEPATEAEESADAEPATEAEESVDAESATEADAAVESDAPADATASGDADATDDVDEAEAMDDADTDDAVEADDVDATDAAGDAAAADADADADADEDGVGDFEPGSLGGDSDSTSDQMYEFDEEERQEIEEEYGTEFSSGNDVPEPEESELDAPEPDPDAAAGDAEPAAESAGDAEPAADDASDDEPAAAEDAGADADETADEPAEDVDVDAFLLDAMREMDDGDGVDRDALSEHVVDETGADAETVEDAIQDALMGGQCYEPEDDVLKPI